MRGRPARHCLRAPACRRQAAMEPTLATSSHVTAAPVKDLLHVVGANCRRKVGGPPGSGAGGSDRKINALRANLADQGVSAGAAAASGQAVAARGASHSNTADGGAILI